MKHKVMADPDLAFRDFNGNTYYPRTDVAEWLRKTMGKRGVFSSKWGWKGRWSVTHRVTESIFSFEKQSDAVMFKLRWGGVQ